MAFLSHSDGVVHSSRCNLEIALRDTSKFVQDSMSRNNVVFATSRMLSATPTFPPLSRVRKVTAPTMMPMATVAATMSSTRFSHR